MNCSTHHTAMPVYCRSPVYPPIKCDPTPHCTGTMSFLKVISSLALGQPHPESITHRAARFTALIHPLTHLRCFAAPFTGWYRFSIQYVQRTSFGISPQAHYLSVSKHQSQSTYIQYAYGSLPHNCPASKSISDSRSRSCEHGGAFSRFKKWWRPKQSCWRENNGLTLAWWTETWLQIKANVALCYVALREFIFTHILPLMWLTSWNWN